MRVAFYVRVSTERQQQAQTIEQQVAQLRSHAAARDGWEVDEAHIFRDDGFSGGKLVRPGLDALRDQAARAAFDLILITAPDRLARNYVHQMVVLEELERRGVRVVFIDRPPSDDPHDQLVLQIRGAVAEYERTLIADRMRRGRLAKLRAGQLLPWTRAPYGYRLHPERPRDPAAVQVDPGAAAIIQELFATCAAGGVALHALAVRLTGRGVPTPTGQAIWKPSTIRGLLTNPAYRGEAISGRLRTTPARRRRSPLAPVGPGVSMHAQPSEDWIAVPVPALVSAEQFEQVRRRLATNQQGARRSTTHPYLLRGLVSCGVCHLACVGCTRSSTETRYRYYRCRGKLPAVSSGLAERCPARFTPSGQLDDLVWADLCAVLRHPEAVAGALERAQSGAWVPDELRRRLTTLRGIRASADRQRARLLDAYLAEVIDLQTFERRDRALREREEELEARERELVAQGRRLVDVGAVASTMSALCQRLSVDLEQASFAQRRQLVELLIDRVVVTDGQVEIRYVIPTTEPSLHTRFCHLRTDYFDPLPDPLADGIAGVASGPAVDGTPAPAGVLGDVRGGAARADVGDAVAGVVVLVPAERLWMEAPVPRLPEQLRRHIPLGRAARFGHLEVDQQSVAILHQGMAHEGQFRFLPFALLEQPRLGIGRALMRLVRPLLLVEVDRRVAGIVRRLVARGRIAALEALQAGACLDQRPVHREVLVRQQPPCLRLGDHLIEELLADLVLQQPRAVLGEGAGVEARLDQTHVQEPPEQEVVLQFLAERPLRPHRVQRDQQRRLQQSLRRDRWPPRLGVDLVKDGRQLAQRRIRQPLDRPDRMSHRHPAFQIHERQHRHLRILLPTHLRHLADQWRHRTEPHRRAGSPSRRFSAAC